MATFVAVLAALSPAWPWVWIAFLAGAVIVALVRDHRIGAPHWRRQRRIDALVHEMHRKPPVT